MHSICFPEQVRQRLDEWPSYFSSNRAYRGHVKKWKQGLGLMRHVVQQKPYEQKQILEMWEKAKRRPADVPPPVNLR